MKTWTAILWLLLIWMISILAFSFFFTIYVANMAGMNQYPNNDEQWAVLLLWIIWGFITLMFAATLSIPALIWFLLTGVGILKTKLSVKIKKLLLITSNYIGIGTSSVVAVLIFIGIAKTENESSSYILNKILTFYPTWSIVALSTICILFIPINQKNK